jgi:hypothetical protein
METVCSSEMSVNFYQATQHHIPEDGILHELSVMFDVFCLVDLNNYHVFKINVFGSPFMLRRAELI